MDNTMTEERLLAVLEPRVADRRQTEGAGGNVPGVSTGQLVAEARASIEAYRCDPWRMSDPVVIAESYARLVAIVDQFDAARAEIRRLRDIEVDLAHDNDIREDRIIELTQDRDNARWADETRRKAAEVIIAERDAYRSALADLLAFNKKYGPNSTHMTEAWNRARELLATHPLTR